MRHCVLIILLLSTFNLYSQRDNPGEFFQDYRIKNIPSRNIIAQVQQASGHIFQLQLDQWTLVVKEAQIFSYDYRSLDHNGNEVTNNIGRAKPLAGATLSGDRAAVTVGEDFILGFIEEGDKTYFIEPLSYYEKGISGDQYIIYEKADIIATEAKSCGLLETEEEAEIRSKFIERSSGLCYEVEYAICNDYSMVSKYGSIANAEMHAIGITNNVNALYNDEFADEVQFIIAGQVSIGCENCDPWSNTTNASQLLTSFREWASVNLSYAPYNITHDVASLWSSRDLDGGIVGVAYIGGACTTTHRYNVLQDFSSDANLKTVLAAHELGHNLNATHDKPGTDYIMAPSITNTSTWSTASIDRIEFFYNNADCFAVCPGFTPQVDIRRDTVNVVESSATINYNDCSIPYFDIVNSILLSHPPDDNVFVEIKADSMSSAVQGLDYDILNTNFLFTANGPLEYTFIVRIYNDLIEEGDEALILNAGIISGPVDPGTVMASTIIIKDANDKVSNICCSDGTSVTYGNAAYYFSGIFLGFAEDAKTRVLFTASQLSGVGLSAGYISQLSLFVQVKYSTGPYQNFRIGMKEVAENEMTNTWYNTTEVFFGDISTVEGNWNDFNFTTPFYWDGISNLYVDFCYDNPSPIGKDYIIGFDPPTANVEFYSFRALNSTIGCSLNTGSFFYYYDRQPMIKFKQVTGAQVAAQAGSAASADLQVGDIAHLYTENNKIIASIENVGFTDIGCLELKINTSGPGKSAFINNPYFYTDKSFEIITENDSAYYEITLYFTQMEMEAWGSESLDLKFLKSKFPFTSSSFDNDNVQYPVIAKAGIGLGNNYGYTLTSRGSGFLALTDGLAAQKEVIISNADLLLMEEERGLLLKNIKGDTYLVSVDSNGTLISEIKVDDEYYASLGRGNLIFQDLNDGLIMRKNSIEFSKLTIDENGNPTTITVSAPTSNVQIPQRNIAFDEPECGIIVKDNLNNCWKLIIDEKGKIICLKVSCTF